MSHINTDVEFCACLPHASSTEYTQLYADDKVIAAGIPDEGLLCDFCNEHINKNLSPCNPACEGRWCDEAYELWREMHDELH